MKTLAALAIALLADIPDATTSAIARHNATVQELQAKKRGANVQRVYESALAVQKSLAGAELTDEDRESLRTSIPALRADGSIDSAYFIDLAATHGNAADADFFATVATNSPGGCLRFADLLSQYKSLFVFSRKHNPAYRSHVVERISAIENAFTSGTCACDDAETVRTALADTVRDFPLGKITPKVRQRLADIDRGASDIQFGCE